ncbi:hypothetical protein Ahy_A09g046644 [Arachis hypogaea]|uniref:Phytocyanin domain-containing protein n=1 Tax=Arachis hypogaea TaxID=3818 RepID=A0A445BQD4_ARAHY|nr:hypothetical protein Ahy_A09g046644 [Arachis hypogaea]
MGSTDFLREEAQTRHVVGGSEGWKIPSNDSGYQDWANNQKFSLGDILVFDFTMNQHNVVEVPKDSHDICSPENAINTTTNSPANFILNKEGQFYYICSFGTHCIQGQKLSIIVPSSLWGLLHSCLGRRRWLLLLLLPLLLSLSSSSWHLWVFRNPLSVFGGFVQFQTKYVTDEASMQDMFSVYMETRSQISFIELYIEFEQSEADRNIELENYNSDSEEEFESNYECLDPGGDGDQADDTMQADVTDVANALVNQHPFVEPTFMRSLDLEAMHTLKFPALDEAHPDSNQTVSSTYQTHVTQCIQKRSAARLHSK